MQPYLEIIHSKQASGQITDIDMSIHCDNIAVAVSYSSVSSGELAIRSPVYLQSPNMIRILLKNADFLFYRWGHAKNTHLLYK